MPSTFLVALLATAATATATSASPASFHDLAEVYFVHVGDAKSIPEGAMTALAQDAQGFVWIGTQHGLVRFDGYEFRRFTHRDGDPSSIGGNYVRALWAAPDGEVWVGTDVAGLSIWSPATGSFSQIGAAGDPTAEPGLSHPNIRALAGDDSGHVFVGTNAGFDVVSRRDHEVTRIGSIEGCSGVLSESRMRSLLVSRREPATVWLGSSTGLCAIDAESVAAGDGLRGRPIEALDGENVFSLFEDRRGRIWAGSAAIPMTVIDPGSLSAEVVELAPAATEGARPIWIFSSAQPSEGEVWLASYGSGVFVIDGETLALKRTLTHDGAVKNSLSHDEVGPMLLDDSGLLWIGTWGGGLDRVDPWNDAIRTLRHSPSRPGALSGPSVYSMVELPDRRLAVGNGHNSVDLLTPTDGVVATIRLGEEGVNARVGALAVTGESDLWIGSNLGLHRYELARGKLSPFLLRGAPYPRQVIQVLPYRERTLAVATTQGLDLIDVATDRIVEHTELEGGGLLDGLTIGDLVELDGALWVGTSQGLMRVLPGERRLERVAVDPQHPLASDAVKSLLVDVSGRLWISSRQGLDRLASWDGAVASFESVNARLGIEPRYIGSNELMDASGRVWTDLVVIDPERWEWQPLDASIGWDVGAQWDGARAKLSDGTLLFGGTDGLLVVSPAAFAEWTWEPPVVAAELAIDNSTRPYAGGPVDLPPGTRSLSVEFAALDFTAPERLRYAHRLVGYEEEWVETGASNRRATYTGLAPGEYSLEVKATNRLGRWSRHRLVVPLRQLPAWYQTWWFRMLSVLAAVALLYLAYRGRVRQLHRQKAELDDLVRSRTENIALLGRMGQKITTSLDLDRVLESVLTSIRELVKVDVLYLGEIDRERDVLATQLSVSGQERFPVGEVRLDEEGHAAVRCIRTEEPLVIGRRDALPAGITVAGPELPAGPAPQSMIYMPLRIQREVVGFLSVQSLRTDAYGDNDVQMVRTIAAYAAIAIANARSHQALEVAHEEIRRISLIDQLTGARNRRFLDQFIGEEIARLERERLGDPAARLGLILLDIDHFKKVNDQYGHAAGDEVLVQVVEVLRATCRKTDWIVRLGGEEFLVLARITDLDELALLTGRIRDHVGAHAFAVRGDLVLRRTVSVGACSYPLIPGDGGTVGWETVLELADRALLHVKQSGRNGWVVVSAAEDLVPERLRDLTAASWSELTERGQLRLIRS